MRASCALLLLTCAAGVAAAQQPRNLLEEPATTSGAEAWRSRGVATIEEFGGRRRFVVRNGGSLSQRVTLPEGASGKFMLFIAWVSSERVAPQDGTDRPYLWGMTLSAEGRVLLFNQGQSMGGVGTQRNERTVAWGIFRVPDGASATVFRMGQALIRGVPHTGSAARFYEPGLFLFATRDEAEAFAERYPFGGGPLRVRPHLP